MSQPCNQCGNNDIFTKHPEKKAELESFLNSLPLSHDIEHNRSFLIKCLHKAQHIFGYLPKEVQELIADKLRLNISDVFGVISFYSFFTTTPPGKFKVNVCIGTACFVRGADKILMEFEQQLGIKHGETTKDLEFSLGGLSCVGACGLAPVVLVNDKVYGQVKPEDVKKIITETRNNHE